MTPFLAVVRVSLRQAIWGRRTVGLTLFALIPAVVMVFTGRGRLPGRLLDLFHEGPFFTLFGVVLPVVSLVLGAAALGDERRDATLSFLLLRPLRRETIVAAKLAAAWLAAFAVAGAGTAATCVVLGIRSGYWSPLAPALLGVAISTLAWTSAALVLGYLTGRAVLIGLAYVGIVENGITFAISGLATVSLLRIGISAYAALLPPGASAVAFSDLQDYLGSVTPGAGGATAKALGVAAAAVAGISWLLRRRDVT